MLDCQEKHCDQKSIKYTFIEMIKNIFNDFRLILGDLSVISRG